MGSKEVEKTKGAQPWSKWLPAKLLALPGLEARLQQAKAMENISFSLPPTHATAGAVLQHAIRAIERLFDEYYPMIFKVGFTHDPVWRWSNPLYGYISNREKWSNMVVLYISDEPFSPAMLEASLIEKFRSGPAVYLFFRYKEPKASTKLM